MIKKLILSIVLLIVVLALSVLFQSVDPEQQDPKLTITAFPDTLANRNYDLDSLKVLVGSNKGLPEGFELAALIAYSAYPELKDVKIDMELIPTGAPMESNFDIPTLFGPKRNRKYIIYLNNASNTGYDEILLYSLPFDAQVGILAHELGHVAYYHQLSTLQIGKWGLNYLNDTTFRATHERTTDLMPVYHGLGSQIYQYAWFVRNDPSCIDLYKRGKFFMDTYYMTDHELLEAINTHPLYSRRQQQMK